MNSSLIAQRRFAPLFWTQALGACNDAFLRSALLGLMALATLSSSGEDPGGSLNMVMGLFIAPFLLFSAWGGVPADRADKQRLIRRLKLLELGIVLVAALMIWLGSGPLLYLLPLLMGVQSALFGPVKYAILPQHLAPTELVNGNAWVGLGTFLAMLAGVLLAGRVTDLPLVWSKPLAGAILIVIAVLGLAASLAIPLAPSRDAGSVPFQPLRSTAAVLGEALRHRVLLLAMLGISIFWFLGTCYLLQLPAWDREVVGGQFTLLLTVLALGAGAGALFCARFSAGRLELGLVAIGAMVIGIGGLGLAATPALAAGEQALASLLAQSVFWKMLAALAAVGVGGGLYVVPLYALIQLSTREERRARMMAANNIFNALLVVVAMLFGIVMLVWLDIGLHRFMATLGVIALLLGVGLLIGNPRPVLRLMIFALVHLIYRLRFRGRHHIPARGAALVVCNHVSFMDALVIGGASPRPLRFLMDRPIYESPWLNWWFRIVGAIPVDADRRDPGSVRRALEEVSRALRQGDVVMLFPEGRLTPDGEMQRFRRGLEIILARDPVPVVPAGLAGLWGSWTSHSGGRALTKLPRRYRARVGLFFGEPVLPEQARRGVLEARVHDLKIEADQWVASQGASRLGARP